MKSYEVWIYDSGSGCCQPMRCRAKSEIEARKIGNGYIRKWQLVDGAIREIRELKGREVQLQ